MDDEIQMKSRVQCDIGDYHKKVKKKEVRHFPWK